MAMLTAPLRTFVSTNVPRGFHSHLPRQHRTGLMVVRCLSAEEGQQEQSAPPKPSSASPPPQLPKAPKPSTKVSTRLRDILAFSGPAPERINGRLAMIGFVAALGVELARGDDLMAQLMNGGVTWFVGTSVLLSIASLVPLLKGVTAQSKSDGFMTSDAELWNGRFAMLGLVALFFTEFVTGRALV